MIVGAVSGVCFAALAAGSLSVLAISPHFFRTSSFVFAIATAYLSYVSFRAATSGRSDGQSFLRAIFGGLAGAVVGLVVVVVAYAMFRQGIRAYFAHPVGLRFSQVTNFRLVITLLWLGFAGGFVLRTQVLRNR